MASKGISIRYKENNTENVPTVASFFLQREKYKILLETFNAYDNTVVAVIHLSILPKKSVGV